MALRRYLRSRCRDWLDHAASKVAAFPDNDRSKSKLTNEAAAIPAGSERGDHNEVAIITLAAGVAKSVCLAVKGGIAKLDAAVVARTDEYSFNTENCGADGYAAFGEAFTGLRDGDGEE